MIIKKSLWLSSGDEVQYLGETDELSGMVNGCYYIVKGSQIIGDDLVYALLFYGDDLQSKLHYAIDGKGKFVINASTYYTRDEIKAINEERNEEFKKMQKIIDSAKDESLVHPSHYTDGGIEPLDYMKAKMSKEMYLGFLIGNVIKYTGRCKNKGTELDDLKKARYYLDKYISEIQ